MRVSGPKSLAWHENTRYALGFAKLTTRSLGIWPLDCQENGSKIVLFFVIMMQLSVTCNLINELMSSCVSVVNAADFVPLLVVNLNSLLKVIVIRLYWRENHYIVESAVNDWSNVCDDRSHKIMRKYAYLARVFFIIPLCIALIAVSAVVIGAPPTVERAMPPWIADTGNYSVMSLRNLPIGTGCFVIGIPTSLYLAIYFLELMQLLAMCNCEFGSNALFFGVTMHLCGQFERLRIDITVLGQKRCDEIHIRNEIRYLIQRHNHLLCLLHLVEGTYNVIMFGNIVISCTNISLFGIQLLFALRDKNYATLVFATFVITFNLMQIYPYSLMGDYLTLNSSAVRNAAYNCFWYNFSTSLTKDLKFVILQSSSAFHLTAWKVFFVNTESFTTIIKTTMSFFSFMKWAILK